MFLDLKKFKSKNMLKMILLGLSFMFITVANSQNSYLLKISEKNKTSKDILNMIFSGNYSESNNTISWRPNPKEFFPVDSFGITNTKIDTVFNYEFQETKYSLYVFNSLIVDENGYRQESNADTPTMSLALFEKLRDSLKLISFNRFVCQNGHMGMFPKLKIVQLGDNFMSISVEEEDYKETDLFITYYSLQQWELGKEIFSIPTWKIISYSETPIIQTAKIKVQKPKTSSSEYFEIVVSNKLMKQTEPNETLIKKWESFHIFNGKRWEKK